MWRTVYVLLDESWRPLDGWIAAWSDLVDFEVVPVIRSSEYWSTVRR